LSGKSEINLLDIGCGGGIFSILFLIKNSHLRINEIVLCDIDNLALSNTYQNLVYYKHLFNFKKITVLKSNLLKEIPSKYHNYFDVVLANMPQTPSKEKIRSKFFFIHQLTSMEGILG
jgi:methylase of polypeptide subunit release factors